MRGYLRETTYAKLRGSPLIAVSHGKYTKKLLLLKYLSRKYGT